MHYDLSAYLKPACDIVEKLSLEEKASLCSGEDFWTTKGLSDYGIESYMLTDGPHGIRKQDLGVRDGEMQFGKSVKATCFPTASGLASTWNRELLHDIGVALGEKSLEERIGVLLGPGINIKRNPLCGRNFEYFSEDPLLTGELAAALINGLQSTGVGASVKHFAVNNHEAFRQTVNATLDTRTLHEIYLRAFEIVVKNAQPATVMCAYNRVNGSYCAEHKMLLQDVLRDGWGFEGYVVSDWGAVNDRALGIAAGLDLEMPGNGGTNDAVICKAVREGQLDEEALNVCARRLVAFSLYAAQLFSQVHEAPDEARHHSLAKSAALESAVLLKNERNCLPLTSASSVAIIGEFAKSPRYQGAGSSQVSPTRLDNAYDAIASFYAEPPTYAQGYDANAAREVGRRAISDAEKLLIEEAVAIAKRVDVAIVFAGLPSKYESEGFDRTSLNLPATHIELIRAVAAVNATTVVVLQNGSAVAMPWADAVPAILEAYLGGQAGGPALADLLYGKANPSGKLAETFPHSADDCPSMGWFPPNPQAQECSRRVEYREGLNVGYRYFNTVNEDVLFPFGHGLSYSTFNYSEATLSADAMTENETVALNVTIENTSTVSGSEVVQVYAASSESLTQEVGGIRRASRPESELIHFQKIHLAPGQRTVVSFEVSASDFSHYCSQQGGWVVASGLYQLRIAASSADIREVLSLKVVGTGALPASYVIPSRNAAGWVMGDDSFAALLDADIPPLEPLRPFHINSTLSDIQSTLVGRKIHQQVERQVQTMMASQGGDSADWQQMVDEMLPAMPLRTLMTMSNGQLTPQLMDLLIDLLNWRLISAAGRVARMIWKTKKGAKL
ncbi:MAG: glycoside hydrolase family 3 C-terminal domain-containing protein [Halioglobus sp.]